MVSLLRHLFFPPYLLIVTKKQQVSSFKTLTLPFQANKIIFIQILFHLKAFQLLIDFFNHLVIIYPVAHHLLPPLLVHKNSIKAN
jgi:hypothetical protein